MIGAQLAQIHLHEQHRDAGRLIIAMEKERITYLVQKLRSGKASLDERNELEELWQANLDDSSFRSIPEDERQAIRQAILAGVRDKIGELEKEKHRQRFLKTTVWSLRIAAVLALVAVSFLFTRKTGDPVTLSTGYGEQKNLILPDGSSVVLNGNTSIHYDQSWNETSDREIWIEGEGFFDVVHSKNHQRFIVHTNNDLSVQVLGTKFNVKVRRGKTEVMLEEGRVRLVRGTDEKVDTLTMKPGELAVIENGKILNGAVNSTRYTSWKNGKLYFDQTPLIEVAKILEDTYGFVVVFKKKSLVDRKLSGEIQAKKGKDILAAIRESLNIEITEDGRTLLFQ
jgi:transmembrane sensor